MVRVGLCFLLVKAWFVCGLLVRFGAGGFDGGVGHGGVPLRLKSLKQTKKLKMSHRGKLLCCDFRQTKHACYRTECGYDTSFMVSISSSPTALLRMLNPPTVPQCPRTKDCHPKPNAQPLSNHVQPRSNKAWNSGWHVLGRG